jgi:hypothetical protein
MMKSGFLTFLSRCRAFLLSFSLLSLLFLSAHFLLVAQSDFLFTVEHSSAPFLLRFLHLPIPDDTHYAVFHALPVPIRVSGLEMFLLGPKLDAESDVPPAVLHTYLNADYFSSEEIPDPRHYKKYRFTSRKSFWYWRNPIDPNFEENLALILRIFEERNYISSARFQIERSGELSVIWSEKKIYLLHGDKLTRVFLCQRGDSIIGTRFIRGG